MNSCAFRVSKWQPQKDSTSLRIMTWNVQSFVNYIFYKDKSGYNDSSRKEMLETIHGYNPDILCFQEYKNIENARKRISIRKQLDSLGYKYFFCSKGYAGSPGRNSHVYVEMGRFTF
jgi:exonuclease III